jgi:hypothetical protein
MAAWLDTFTGVLAIATGANVAKSVLMASRYRSRFNCGSIVLLPVSTSSSLFLNFYLFFTTSKFSNPSAFYFHEAIPKRLASKDRVREDLLLLSLTAVETSAKTFWIVYRQEIKVSICEQN